MFYFAILCLFCKSDDVNDDINETLPSNIGTILHEFEPYDRKIVPGLGYLAKKQINARYAVIFTQTCIDENLSPNFIYNCQINGIAKGVPLGVLFTEVFMAHVEYVVLIGDAVEEPALYCRMCRYIDDILVKVRDHDHLLSLKAELEQISCLIQGVPKVRRI